MCDSRFVLICMSLTQVISLRFHYLLLTINTVVAVVNHNVSDGTPFGKSLSIGEQLPETVTTSLYNNKLCAILAGTTYYVYTIGRQKPVSLSDLSQNNEGKKSCKKMHAITSQAFNEGVSSLWSLFWT